MKALKTKYENLRKEMAEKDIELALLRGTAPNMDELALSMEELPSIELQEFCDLNPKKCSDESLWKGLVRRNFEDIYILLESDQFVDLERDTRTQRVFSPWRSLYTELLALSTIPDALDALNVMLDGERPHVPLLSFTMEAKKGLVQFHTLLLALSVT